MKLVIAWCTLFVVGTDLFVVSPLLPMIAADFNLPAAATGLSVTAFAVAYMISAPVLGHFADRLGRRPMLTCCLFAFAAANLLTAASPNLVALVGARIAAGIATAGVSPSIYALVGESAPPARRATWMATAVCGLLVSLSFGAPIGAMLGASFGWAKVFDILAGLALLLVIANQRIWPAPQVRAAVEASADGAAPGRMARRLLPTVVWATALYGTYIYLGVWLTRLGCSTEQIAQVITFYGCGAIVGTFAGGRIADRLGPRAATSLSLIGLFACFTALALTAALHAGLWALTLGIAVASAVAQLFFPAQQAGLVGDFPDRRATVLAWNNSSLFLGIALGSLIGGQAATYGSFAASLAVCGAIAFAGWLINGGLASEALSRRGQRSGA